MATHCFVVWSVFQWQPAVLPLQSALQIGLSAVMFFSLIWLVIQFNRHATSRIMVLCESGQCELTHMQKYSQWIIASESRCSAWLLWLKLQSVSDPSDCFWLWLFRDQVTDDDFRRISRVVHRSQQSHSLTTK